MTEEEQRAWVQAAQNGDESGFEKIFRHYQVSLFNWARHLVGDADEAEDVVQQAFIKVFHALPKMREPGALEYWLKRIVYNASMDTLRKRKRQAESTLGDTVMRRYAATTRGPEGDLLQGEEREMVQEALKKMNPRYRALILMREFDGMSYEEIGETTGEPLTTVRVALFRARAQLRELLRQVVEEVRYEP
jgi:RNA polymerase sigma-70 factor (ECF subfamily)